MLLFPSSCISFFITGMMEQYDFIFGITSYAGMPITGRAYDYGKVFFMVLKEIIQMLSQFLACHSEAGILIGCEYE